MYYIFNLLAPQTHSESMNIAMREPINVSNSMCPVFTKSMIVGINPAAKTNQCFIKNSINDCSSEFFILA